MADEEQEQQAQAEEPAQAPATAGPGMALLDQVFEKLDLEKPARFDVDRAAASEAEKEKLPVAVAQLVHWALKFQETLKKVDAPAVQRIIDRLDTLLSEQLTAVYHHPDFQKLESSWRSLRFLVDRTEFRGGMIKLLFLNASKEDLKDDFDDAPEIPQAGLYRHVYTDAYDVFGEHPYGAMIANYEFSQSAQDVALLQSCANVAAASHCPFISSAGKRFFGLDDIKKLSRVPDVGAIFEQAEYTKWNSFRESEDARYVGLCVPRFQLRLPYGPGDAEQQVKEFSFNEHVLGEDHENYLWGNAAFALASNMVRSFHRNGWCSNVVGVKGGGLVEDLPYHLYEDSGEVVPKCPTETAIGETNEYALSEYGFVTFVHEKNKDRAVFFDAQSCQKPKKYDTDEATANAKMNAALYNVLLCSRFAHYIKLIQKKNLGSFMEAEDLQTQMNRFLSKYVSEAPTLENRDKYPLKWAEAKVEAIPSNPGWYRVRTTIRPFFKLRGMDVDISLVSRIPTGEK